MPRIARTLRVWLLFVSSVALSACDNGDSMTAPTDVPNSVAITQTFSATLPTNGARQHLIAAQPGTVTAILAALSPSDSPIIGLAIGVWNGSFCSDVIAKDDATAGASVTGEATGASTLCVRVFDSAGMLVTPVEYVVMVTHY